MNNSWMDSSLIGQILPFETVKRAHVSRAPVCVCVGVWVSVRYARIVQRHFSPSIEHVPKRIKSKYKWLKHLFLIPIVALHVHSLSPIFHLCII